MANDGPARVVWVAEVQPVCETDSPSLVVDLIDKRPILVRDPKCGDARHAFGIRGMKRTSGTRTCTNGSKIGVGRVRWTERRRRGGQSLV